MHNQTINVYSHLVGAIIFISYPMQLYRDSQLSSSLVQWEDYLVLTIYCYGVATCLLFSSMSVSSQ
jgi:predicted membrane channel-forming protein YqfA (hemolysin III family)